MNAQVNKLAAGKGHKYPIDFDPFSKNAVEERKEVTAIRSFYYNSDDGADVLGASAKGNPEGQCRRKTRTWC